MYVDSLPDSWPKWYIQFLLIFRGGWVEQSLCFPAKFCHEVIPLELNPGFAWVAPWIPVWCCANCEEIQRRQVHCGLNELLVVPIKTQLGWTQMEKGWVQEFHRGALSSGGRRGSRIGFRMCWRWVGLWVQGRSMIVSRGEVQVYKWVVAEECIQERIEMRVSYPGVGSEALIQRLGLEWKINPEICGGFGSRQTALQKLDPQ